MPMTIKAILFALLVASLFAFVGLQVSSDLSATYGVTMSDNTSSRYQVIQDESNNVATKVNQTYVWLQDLTSGNILGFIYAMPTNIANVLGVFLTLPNLAYSVFDSTLAIFGIPSFVSGIIAVMLIITVVLIIVGIWTEGRV
jgi:hypothetical protein